MAARMQRTRAFLTGFLGVAFSLSAGAAEDWLPIPSVTSNIAFFLDKASIERKDGWVQFWERMVYDKPQVKDEGSGILIKEKRVQRLMNCDEGTQVVAYGAIYGENSSFITSTTFDEAHREKVEIPPGTIAEAEFKLLCPKPAQPSGTFFGLDFGH